MPAVPVPYTAEQDGLKHAADARNFASQKVQKGLTSCPSVQICPQKEAQLVVESPGPDMSSHTWRYYIVPSSFHFFALCQSN